MRYQLIGVNHKSAPLEVRERLAIPESRLPDCCRDLTAHPGIEEGMIISTCNRVEMITHTSNGSADLRGFLHHHFDLKAEDLVPHLYEFREKDAVRHVFRVAASLDSMIVGEAQILGQVKEAYATARAVGSVRGQARSSSLPAHLPLPSASGRGNCGGIFFGFHRLGRGRTCQRRFSEVWKARPYSLWAQAR